MATGTVKWFNDQKGFGFISRMTRKDLFVHKSGIGSRRLDPPVAKVLVRQSGEKGPKTWSRRLRFTDLDQRRGRGPGALGRPPRARAASIRRECDPCSPPPTGLRTLEFPGLGGISGSKRKTTMAKLNREHRLSSVGRGRPRSSPGRKRRQGSQVGSSDTPPGEAAAKGT